MVSISFEVGLRGVQPLAAHAEDDQADAALGEIGLDRQQLGAWAATPLTASLLV
jgi:hypothetical protein